MCDGNVWKLDDKFIWIFGKKFGGIFPAVFAANTFEKHIVRTCVP